MHFYISVAVDDAPPLRRQEIIPNKPSLIELISDNFTTSTQSMQHLGQTVSFIVSDPRAAANCFRLAPSHIVVDCGKVGQAKKKKKKKTCLLKVWSLQQ